MHFLSINLVSVWWRILCSGTYRNNQYLNNIRATLSVFNFYFFGKKIRRQMSWYVLKLDLNSAWWMPKLVSIDAQSYPAFTSQSLRGTIGPLQDNWSLFHYVIGISGILPYNRNVTLQTLRLRTAL